MSIVPPASDPLLTCPYEPSHQILKSRFEVHLVRCRKSHKDVKKATCPFNVTHLVNEPELNWHATVCPDRAAFDTYKYIVDTGVDSGKNNDAPPAEHEPIDYMETWENSDYEGYNPTKYASTAPVLRQKIGAPRSEKKAFREAERRRLRNEFMQ